jgi:urease accessory protein
MVKAEPTLWEIPSFSLPITISQASGPNGDHTDKQWSYRPRDLAFYVDEPLNQRPAGSAGKHGVCALSFAAHEGKTRLRHTFVTHPFHLTRPWYLDSALPGMAVVYIQTPAGGLIQGDRTFLSLRLGAGTQVHLTSQAAEKIHTMTANCAVQNISLILETDAYAEYCPEPVILFPDARFTQEMNVELGPGASFFFSEVFLSRQSPTGRWFDFLSTRLNVRDARGKLLIRDHSLVQPQQQHLRGPGALGKHHIWGQALLVGPRVSSSWARDLHALLSTEYGMIGGATVLPGECGVVAKVVGSEAQAVRHALHAVWSALRTRHLGVPASAYPK